MVSIHIVSRLESFTDDGPPFADLQREFNRAVLLEQRGAPVALAFTIHFASGIPWVGDTGVLEREVNLFRDHGIRPALVLLLQAREHGLIPALREYVRRRTGVWHPEPITRVEMHLFST